MRYLIDTNIYIYLVQDRHFLHRDVLEILEDYTNIFFISSESVKELIVLSRNGKVKLKRWKTEKQIIVDIEKEFGIKILPIKKEHLLTFAELNPDKEHKDPSDHIIISQAITDKMTLISSDRRFEFYTNQGLSFVFNQK